MTSDPAAQLLATFLAETDELLAALERGALALADDPDGAEVLLPELFRIAHTMKGNASCLGFDALTAAAHHLEDHLAAALRDRRKVEPALIVRLFDAVDELRRLAAAAAAGQDDEPWTPATEATAPVRTIRVEVTRLDRAMELAGGLTQARGRLASAIARGDLVAAAAAVGLADSLGRELEAQVLALRLVPLRSCLERFRRAVHDLGQQVGKEVHLEVRCDDGEVDMAVAEALRAPLTHLIRNAIDHGLEPAARRAATGKPRQGQITLAARLDSGQLVIEVADDGGGIDRSRLLERAAAIGLSTAGLDGDRVLDLVFAPGLSTAQSVGALSGRGIGMDVVRRSIEALRGSVAIASAPGAGATVTIRMPLALSIVQGLVVRVAGQPFVVPIDSVAECLDLDMVAERLDLDGARAIRGGVLSWRDQPLPCLDLGRELASAPAGPRRSLVVVEQDGRRAGLEVDQLVGETQTVIKPIGGLFEGARGIAGSAVLADGELALVVDVRGLLRTGTN